MSNQLSKQISKHHTRKRISFPWEVAIHSIHSATVCRDAALKVLKHYKIPATKIIVFIPEGQKESHYKSVLKSGTYHKIVETRGSLDKFVDDYFPCGTQVLHLEDSVKGFLEVGGRLVKSLLAVIKTGFLECEKNNAGLWGIYPHAVGSLLRLTVSTELKYISGCFWGCISLGSTFLKYQVPEKADYERSILYYKRYKKVIRLNFVAAVYSHPESSKTATRALAKEYPDYTVLTLNRKGGLEIRLRTPDGNKDG